MDYDEPSEEAGLLMYYNNALQEQVAEARDWDYVNQCLELAKKAAKTRYKKYSSTDRVIVNFIQKSREKRSEAEKLEVAMRKAYMAGRLDERMDRLDFQIRSACTKVRQERYRNKRDRD